MLKYIIISFIINIPLRPQKFMSLKLQPKDLIMKDFFIYKTREIAWCIKCEKDFSNHFNDMKKHLYSGKHNNLEAFLIDL